MELRKVAVIFILPIIIILWSIGWVMAFIGNNVNDFSKEKYDVCLKILHEKEIEV